MTDTFLLCFALVAVTAACAVAARRLRVPYSIVLVITGIALAFVPGLPKVELDPRVVMLLFLPPLLYMAGVSMSWRGFRDNLRPIALLAVGCVLFTACAVAAVAHWAIGLPWGVGFVLGAVVSPPDVLAPHGDCAAASGAQAHPDHPGRRRSRERCDRPDPVPLRSRGRRNGRLLNRECRRCVRPDCDRRDAVRGASG